MGKKMIRKTKELEEVTMKELRASGKNWMTVKKAANIEGVTVGRIYHHIWAKRRDAVKFGGITLVVPAPRRRKASGIGRPRISQEPSKILKILLIFFVDDWY
jgi:hypothetical protein